MAIITPNNGIFPAEIGNAIQLDYLEREFLEGLHSVLGYREIAEKTMFMANVGESITSTRTGLLIPTTDAINPANNVGLDNGLTPTNWAIEQYTVQLNMYSQSLDLNIVTQRVGIADQFLANARKLGTASMQSLDRLARDELFNAYLSGNTMVRVTLGAPNVTIEVDDIRGFQTILVNGRQTAVSPSNQMLVTFGTGVTGFLEGAVADVGNVSVTPGGISGQLTFDAPVQVAEGTLGEAVVGEFAPSIIRPNGKKTVKELTGSDTFSLDVLLDQEAVLLSNNAPVKDGYFNLYLDPISHRQLVQDEAYQLLYRGTGTNKQAYKGTVVDLVSRSRVIVTTEPVQQAADGTFATVAIHRPILCADGALVEAQFEDMAAPFEKNDEIMIHEGVAHVTRMQLDRLAQIVSQSWYWIGGFVVPTDATATSAIIPTASNSYFKRAVICEHA